MTDNITIKLCDLKSDFYDVIKEEFDDDDENNNKECTIIRFSPLVTDDVVDSFNNKSYTSETMDGIVELYNYLQIDLKETYSELKSAYEEYKFLKIKLKIFLKVLS